MNAPVIAALNVAAFFIGQMLVTRRRWTGFLIWAGSNSLVAATCVAQAQLTTAVMFLVYFAANVCSMVRWMREPKSPRKSRPPVVTPGGTSAAEAAPVTGSDFAPRPRGGTRTPSVAVGLGRW